MSHRFIRINGQVGVHAMELQVKWPIRGYYSDFHCDLNWRWIIYCFFNNFRFHRAIDSVLAWYKREFTKTWAPHSRMNECIRAQQWLFSWNTFRLCICSQSVHSKVIQFNFWIQTSKLAIHHLTLQKRSRLWLKLKCYRSNLAIIQLN